MRYHNDIYHYLLIEFQQIIPYICKTLILGKNNTIMKYSKHIESFSIITKEEKVKTLTHNIVSNTFVIEIISPLPGYYGAEYLISHEKPGHVLFITKDYVHFEDFFRMQNKIKAYINFGFDATFASIVVRNTRLDSAVK